MHCLLGNCSSCVPFSIFCCRNRHLPGFTFTTTPMLGKDAMRRELLHRRSGASSDVRLIVLVFLAARLRLRAVLQASAGERRTRALNIPADRIEIRTSISLLAAAPRVRQRLLGQSLAPGRHTATPAPAPVALLLHSLLQLRQRQTTYPVREMTTPIRLSEPL